MSKTKSKTTPPPAKPAIPDREIELYLRCHFTEKETLELGKKLAESSNTLEQQTAEAKAIAKQHKAKCDQTAAKVREFSTKISTGYESRPIRCIVKYNSPKTGQKTILRTDLNEIVDVEEMTMGEMQIPLPLEPGAQAQKVTHGTVEVAADKGSRDDAGPESKNT